ncbi:hypothetical protein BKI52_38965 [marine bacterium AO1-C]|nr:hypothetical protein BKI52_38965 [marine bacterium AO1-C]
MGLNDLGYSDKWIEYGFLNDKMLKLQLDEFHLGNDPNPEHYRYKSFLNWLDKREKLLDQEVINFIELALEDSDQTMAGSALKELLTSAKITEKQFQLIKPEFARLGEWATKVIEREVLKRKNE